MVRKTELRSVLMTEIAFVPKIKKPNNISKRMLLVHAEVGTQVPGWWLMMLIRKSKSSQLTRRD